MPAISKLPNTGTTIFTVMSQLATQHDALNLSQGFPDFSAPADLIDAVHRAMLAGRNQYAPMTGVPELRAAIAEKILAFYQVSVNRDTEITVTSGATDALFTAITAVVHAGDEVIIFDPAYDSYEPAIRLAGGVAVRISLRPEDFSIDWDQVRDKITDKTRLIVINSPHNPTGAIINRTDLDALAGIVAGTRIEILSDEVYEHIVFDGRRHESLLSHPDLRQRSFVVSSFGKTYHVTGWKIAYCVAPPAMSNEFRKVHQYITFCTSSPMQYALAEFMSASNHHLELAGFYQRKRDLFASNLRESRFSVLPCSGTYFQLLDYTEISDESDLTLARRLTMENGIASIPISVFCKEDSPRPVLRFCFAKHDETLEAAADILCAI